jgi:predicted ATPase/class 3 adenylate cyclase
MPALPTGTVTFLFTDVAGSTRLLQQLGDRYAEALSQHRQLLRAAYAAHGGVEVDTQGDAFFVAFPTAPAAVAAAAQATRALAEHAWPESTTLQVRMGLHTGTPQLVGDHYVGLDVHRGARIAAAGHGGQVLLSEVTRVLTEHALPPGATLRDVGAHRLKDLQHPEHISQLVLPGLPADFPALKALDSHPHNLPIQPTPLLGREREVATVSALLHRNDVRLVTLTGPGGTGKTRLGLQVAAELVDDFPDGVWFVRLSRLSDPTLVVPTIAQTLGLKEAGSQPITETLQEHLRAKQLLLVLDNCEQVMGAAPEVASLLAVCPGVRALATSRIPLRLRGEKVYTVAPLPLATPGDALVPERLAQYAAVALFIERARDAWSDFAVTVANAPAIAAVCTRLDGLPLAIELAAAHVKLLPPEALLARLSSQLLAGGARDLEARQQTMQRTIAWSEDLLTPQECVLFRRLAVFAGGCTLEACEAVCVAPPGVEPLGLGVLEGLGTLVDHNLMQQRGEGGEPRFGMLRVIREYALERLEASGEAEALHQAHAASFVALAEQAEPELTGPEAAAWLDRLEGEHDNLRAALGWARERGEADTGLRLVAALWRFWWVRGHLREGRAWVERMLALATGPGAVSGTGGVAHTASALSAEVRTRALLAGGALALWQGDFAAAEPRLAKAAAQARAAGDRRTTARALNQLGILANRQRDWERARARHEESLALYRQVGDRRGIGVALGLLGDLAVYQGDLERAADATTEALALSRQVGDRANVALTLANLGWVARKRGEVAQAEALGREALTLAWELGDPLRCAEVLENLASTAGVAGHGVRAARRLGAAAALREAGGAPQPPQEREDTQEAVAAARAALGEDAWAVAFAAGWTMTLEAAIAEALGEAE